MDFTVHASLPEHQEERQTVEAMMRTRKELVPQAAINEGLDRKNDLLLGHVLPSRPFPPTH